VARNQPEPKSSLTESTRRASELRSALRNTLRTSRAPNLRRPIGARARFAQPVHLGQSFSFEPARI